MGYKVYKYGVLFDLECMFMGRKVYVCGEKGV